MLRALRKILVSDEFYIFGISDDEKSSLKKALTFENPAYINAKRYTRYNRVSLLQYIMYYEETFMYDDFGNKHCCFKVPLGVDLSKYLNLSNYYFEDIRIDNPIKSKISFLLTPREEQSLATEKYLTYVEKCNEGLKEQRFEPFKNIIKLPTGKGKSILGLYIASQLKVKTLIVVHKDDLVTGWKKDIKLAFGEDTDIGLIKAKSRKVGEFVTIATVQTLNKLTEEEICSLDQFGFIIQDEMHHCPASSYSVVSKFTPKYRLGITATDERNDGLSQVLNLYYGDIVYEYDSSNIEGETDILPFTVFRKTLPIYFNPVYSVIKRGEAKSYVLKDKYRPKGSLNKGEIRLSDIPYNERPKISYQNIDSYVVTLDYYKREVCKDILSNYNLGYSCVVFFSQKEHIRIYRDYLIDKLEIPEEDIGLLYGDNKDNDLVLQKAENKRKFITLTTYSKSTEGTNVKQWEVEFFVSSMNNEKNTEQAVGRIRRTKPEGNKLEIPRVYDYRCSEVYSLSSHGYTRDKRYRKMLGETSSGSQSIFKRGFAR